MSWTQLDLFTSQNHSLEFSLHENTQVSSSSSTPPTTSVFTGTAVCGVALAGQIIITNDVGSIFVYNANKYSPRDLKPFQVYKIFQHRIYFMAPLTNKPSHIAIVGEDQTHLPIFKCIDIDKETYRLKHALALDKYVGVAKTITNFACSSTGEQLALALSDGSVILITIDDLQVAPPSASGRLLFPPQSLSISGLHFVDIPLPNSYNTSFETRLFITIDTSRISPSQTTNEPALEAMTVGIYAIDAALMKAKRRTDIPYLVLDEYRSIPAHCSCVLPHTCELLVAQPEALYSYSVEERGAAIGLDGSKKHVVSVGPFVLLVAEEVSGNAINSLVSVYDLRKRCQCYRLSIPGTILFAMAEPSSSREHRVHLLSDRYELVVIEELSLDDKAQVFIKAHQFEGGLVMAAESNASPELFAVIYKAYGDALYGRGDFLGAYNKYSYTVGSRAVPATYIMQLFIDEQHRGILTRYLLLLLDKSIASPEQVDMLLIACADASVETLRALPSLLAKTSLAFDQERLLHLLFSRGLQTEAMDFAVKRGLHSSLIGYLANSDDASLLVASKAFVALSDTASPAQLLQLLRDCADSFLAHCPGRFTQLLVFFCTRSPDRSPLLAVDDCIDLYLGTSSLSHLQAFLQQLQSRALLTTKAALTLLEILLLASPRDAAIIELLQTSLAFKDHDCIHAALMTLREHSYMQGEIALLERSGPTWHTMLLETLYRQGDPASIHIFIRKQEVSQQVCLSALDKLIQLSLRDTSSCGDDSKWLVLTDAVIYLRSSSRLGANQVLRVLSKYENSIPSAVASHIL